jgi:tetratricopeptide (TPR) repeat protein
LLLAAAQGVGALVSPLGPPPRRPRRAEILGFQDRFAEQQSEFATLRASLQEDPDESDRFLYRNPVYAIAASRAGRHDEAVAIMKSAAADRERLLGPDHALTAQALGQLALVLSAASERDQALAVFRRAIPALLRDAPLSLGGTATRRATTIAILEAYISLLMSLPDDTGDLVAEAFQIAAAPTMGDFSIRSPRARARPGPP